MSTAANKYLVTFQRCIRQSNYGRRVVIAIYDRTNKWKLIHIKRDIKLPFMLHSL